MIERIFSWTEMQCNTNWTTCYITFSLLMPICSFCHGSHGASKYAIVLMKGNEREREREREREMHLNKLEVKLSQC